MRIDLLRELCEVPGPPGREERVRELVIRELEPVVDEIRTDAMGNVIARRAGKGGPRLMVAAHMDEIGFMITHVDDNGFLRFIPLGGFDAKTLVAQSVVVHGRRDIPGVLGSKPIHIMSEEEKKAAPKIEDFFIDVGLPKEEVLERVAPGDVATRAPQFREIGGMINGKSFDDRLGLFLLIEAVRSARDVKAEVFAVASVQEEVGLRGAQVATRAVEPDVGIALDVTLANDVPDAKPHEQITKLGGGAAIKVMDSSVLATPALVAFMRRIAEEEEIPHQMEILPRGGTDTAAMQRFGKGAAAGCISVPTRYVHSVIEMCHRRDIEAGIRLLEAVIRRIHECPLQG
ncbi:MAG: M42 family metallopeptidase [Planctomycetes bacterium]|nr:M42 family metallopeptidase [Planctomycetota bacterium]